MIIDMHVHTAEGSECARAGIMDYMLVLERLREEGRGVDALIITDHGTYCSPGELDEELSTKFKVLILRGVEVNTDYCHMLLYGMRDQHWKSLDWSGERTLSAREIIETASITDGMVVVPAHPFRACPVGGHRDFSGVSIMEVFNGANNETQDIRALDLARDLNCRSIAGSDAHEVEELGRCTTRFDAPINSMEELVEELEKGRFKAMKHTPCGQVSLL